MQRLRKIYFVIFNKFEKPHVGSILGPFGLLHYFLSYMTPKLHAKNQKLSASISGEKLQLKG